MVALIQTDRPSWDPSDDQLALWSEALGKYEPGVLQRAARSFLEREKGAPNLARVAAYCRDILAAQPKASEERDTTDERYWREMREDPEEIRLTELAFKLAYEQLPFPPGPDRDAYLELCKRKGWVPYSGPGTLVGASVKYRDRYKTVAQQRLVEQHQRPAEPWATDVAKLGWERIDAIDRYGI